MRAGCGGVRKGGGVGRARPEKVLGACPPGVRMLRRGARCRLQREGSRESGGRALLMRKMPLDSAAMPRDSVREDGRVVTRGAVRFGGGAVCCVKCRWTWQRCPFARSGAARIGVARGRFAAAPYRSTVRRSACPPVALSVESRRHEGQDFGQRRLPVAPRVAPVAHTEFERDVPLAHERIETDVALPQIVVVAAVDPPAHGAQRLGLVVGEPLEPLQRTGGADRRGELPRGACVRRRRSSAH